MQTMPMSLALICAATLTSCAHVSSTTATYDSAGRLTGRTTMRGTTVLDSHADVAKAINHTAGTNGQGTAVAGYDAQSTGSNIVAIAQALAAIAQKVP